MFSELLGTRMKKQEQDQERRQPTWLLRGLLPKFAESWTSLTQGILSLLLVSICAVLGYRALVYNVFWFGWGWKVLGFKYLLFPPLTPTVSQSPLYPQNFIPGSSVWGFSEVSSGPFSSQEHCYQEIKWIKNWWLFCTECLAVKDI